MAHMPLTADMFTYKNWHKMHLLLYVALGLLLFCTTCAAWLFANSSRYPCSVWHANANRR